LATKEHKDRKVGALDTLCSLCSLVAKGIGGIAA